ARAELSQLVFQALLVHRELREAALEGCDRLLARQREAGQERQLLRGMARERRPKLAQLELALAQLVRARRRRALQVELLGAQRVGPASVLAHAQLAALRHAQRFDRSRVVRAALELR